MSRKIQCECKIKIYIISIHKDTDFALISQNTKLEVKAELYFLNR